MKLNLLLALGLVLSIGVAVVHDQQKAAEFEERARAAEVIEANREEAFSRTRLAANVATHANDVDAGSSLGQASK